MSKKTLVFSLLAMLLQCMPATAKMRCTPVYVFGASASFCDSIVYFTDIQVLDSAWIDEKTEFLVNRWDYSNQLRNHFNQTGHLNRTCIVCFSTKEKDIRKKYDKMRKKFKGTTKKPTRYDIRQLDEDEFQFYTVKPSIIDEESQKALEKEAQRADKPSKKQKPTRPPRNKRSSDTDNDTPPSMPPRR